MCVFVDAFLRRCVTCARRGGFLIRNGRQASNVPIFRTREMYRGGNSTSRLERKERAREWNVPLSLSLFFFLGREDVKVFKACACECESTRVFLQIFLNADVGWVSSFSFFREGNGLWRCHFGDIKKSEKNAVFSEYVRFPLSHTKDNHNTRTKKDCIFPQILWAAAAASSASAASRLLLPRSARKEEDEDNEKAPAVCAGFCETERQQHHL